MATLKAFVLVALVFGVFTVGPFIVTIVGLAFALWFIRAMILQEKELGHGNPEGSDYRGFTGGERLITRREPPIEPDNDRSGD